MQRIPYFQQHTFAVFPPMTVPKSQFFDALRRQIPFALRIMLLVFRQAVLETVEFHRQLCHGTIKVQTVNSTRMLAAKFEAGKSPRPQRAP